jgi:hypothetical protein
MEQSCGVQLIGTGLCLELNRQSCGVQLTGTGLYLELNRTGVGRAVNRYRFVFDPE